MTDTVNQHALNLSSKCPSVVLYKPIEQDKLKRLLDKYTHIFSTLDMEKFWSSPLSAQICEGGLLGIICSASQHKRTWWMPNLQGMGVGANGYSYTSFWGEVSMKVKKGLSLG